MFLRKSRGASRSLPRDHKRKRFGRLRLVAGRALHWTRRRCSRERFDIESLKDVFDCAFDFFSQELESRKGNFFVSRGEMGLLNKAEVRGFKADVVQVFLDEFRLRLQEAKKPHKRPFLEGVVLYAEILKEIGQRKMTKKLGEFGPDRVFQGENIQILKITNSVFEAAAEALEKEAAIELKNLTSKKKQKFRQPRNH